MQDSKQNYHTELHISQQFTHERAPGTRIIYTATIPPEVLIVGSRIDRWFRAVWALALAWAASLVPSLFIGRAHALGTRLQGGCHAQLPCPLTLRLSTCMSQEPWNCAKLVWSPAVHAILGYLRILISHSTPHNHSNVTRYQRQLVMTQSLNLLWSWIHWPINELHIEVMPWKDHFRRGSLVGDSVL